VPPKAITRPPSSKGRAGGAEAAFRILERGFFVLDHLEDGTAPASERSGRLGRTESTNIELHCFLAPSDVR